MRHVLRICATLALLAAPTAARPEAPGVLDVNGYKIPPSIIYCLGPSGRVGPCGGPGSPLAIVNMPAQGSGGGVSVYRVNSPAGTSPMVVKASAGRLYSYNLCNTAGSSRYVRFYDTASATIGTSPVAAGPIVISASACQQFSSSFGLSFGSAISVGITSAPGDTDVTPISAGDVTGFMGFM